MIAHAKKTVGGGLAELRQRLAAAGVADPQWHEVRKSRKASDATRRALEAGAELVFVWGGDGTVQRCVDALAGRGVPMAIVPAGTANQLAFAFGIPRDIARAVDIGLHGHRHRIDAGSANGERFAAMAGAGFDARMTGAVSGRRKRRWGQLAYVWAGVRQLRVRAVPGRVELDGCRWFEGPIGCVLVGNVGQIRGGVKVFPDARPDDGWLEVGVVTAEGVRRWLSVLAYAARGRAADCRWVRVGRARHLAVDLHGELPYELDGGFRSATRRLEFSVEPGAVTLCVPVYGGGASGNSAPPGAVVPGQAVSRRDRE